MKTISENLIAHIRGLHREHRALQNARGDMERRIKAEYRWQAAQRHIRDHGPVVGKYPPVTDEDKLEVVKSRQRFFEVREFIETNRKEVKKQLDKLASELPAAAWVESVRGLGIGSLAAIVGEAGDLSNYPTVSKLWKRFSLHVVDGHGARRTTKVADVEAESFKPRRRAEMHVIGDTLLRASGPAADLIRARKAYEIAKAQAAGLKVVPAGQIPKGKSDGYISVGHIHKRALRYAEKRVLREIWRVWNGKGASANPFGLGSDELEKLAA